MNSLIHIALAFYSALALFQVAGTPGSIEVVEGYEPVLHVGPCAHLGSAAHEDTHLSGAYFGKQRFLLCVGVCVVDKGNLVLRYSASH